MPTRRLKPDTPSRRYMSISTFEEITKKRPERKLTTELRKTGGRNNHGRITSRHRGGGHRRRYRIIDFKRNKYDMIGEIISIEYDQFSLLGEEIQVLRALNTLHEDQTCMLGD